MNMDQTFIITNRNKYNKLTDDNSRLGFIKYLYINYRPKLNQFVELFGGDFNTYIKILEYFDIKWCSNENCSIRKPQSRSNFVKKASNYDGLYSLCKSCSRSSNKNYSDKTKDKKKEYDKQHREKNKDLLKQKRQDSEYSSTKKYNNSFAKYNTYSERLKISDEIRRDPNNNKLLQVRCTWCNIWFNPLVNQIVHRVAALNNKKSIGTENRFYCSDNCKKDCPIYRKMVSSLIKIDSIKSGNKNQFDYSREVQKDLRIMVLERDNWTCLKCNKYKDDLDVPLHAHHKEGIRWEPIESADTDQCITVCKTCHIKIHEQVDCRYIDLRCK